jgi:uncharacterized lipoprotein YddW (UPF0748 family)
LCFIRFFWYYMSLFRRFCYVFSVLFLGQCTPRSQKKITPISRPIFQISPKREFRGVWVATVANIDWPSKKNLESSIQQKEFTDILDNHQKVGINAVLVQVRAASDAFYARSREPWSEWLTGTQGKSPEPYYDPMRFMIEQAHQRNMEFHAWLNLNRGTHTTSRTVSFEHITKTKPKWFLDYGGYKIYNFGLPFVREYILELVLEMVKNYDLDGIHFDDYFYPYTVANQKLKDDSEFKKYGRGFDKVEDWRRHNINLLIKEISESIAREKKWVKFGVSPFGVWRNADKDPKGSNTQAGQTSYDDLFADTRKWAQNGWIDYIAPQIYFAFEHPKVPYKTLADWWSENHGQRHLYIGHSTYRIDAKSQDINWASTNQLPRQIRYNRGNPEISGSIFYNTNSLMKNNLGFTDSLKNYYARPVLLPAMPWKDAIPPNSPENVEVKWIKDIGAIISWEPPQSPSRDKDPVHAYAIYRFEENENMNLDNGQNLIAVQRNVGLMSFIDNTADHRKKYYYLITALDRLHNESAPSNQFFLK